jgi:hypothetical protein
MNEQANVKAWVENLTSLRGKMEARKSVLLAEVAEIDAALAQFSPQSGKAARADKANGHSNGNGLAVNGATYRALVLAAVSTAEHGLDSDALSKAVKAQRRGADRKIVLATARGLVADGSIRCEGKRRAFTYYPIAAAK